MGFILFASWCEQTSKGCSKATQGTSAAAVVLPNMIYLVKSNEELYGATD